VRAARPGDAVRLLPPSDPLLQGRDREVLVPDAEHRRAVWANLGAPGVLLSGVDVVGVWRTRQRGKRLTVAVEPFGALTKSQRAGVAEEAGRVAAARGADPGAVEVTG